jgi:hypothetical protein
MMNPEAQAELDRIVAIEPAALSEAEVGFLQARRSYLSEEQKAVYAEVLNAGPALAEQPEGEIVEAVEVETVTDAEGGVTEAPAKKAKK